MKLDDLLNEYRAELDAAQAPSLEHLFAEEASGRRRPVGRYWGLALSGLAAAASLAWVFWPAPQAPAPRIVAAVPAAPPVVEVAKEVPLEAVVPARQAVRGRPARFVALAEMDMLPVPRTYQIVHVSVDAERLVGLGLRADSSGSGQKVAAQVLLGEDGIARAIRVLGEERD
jgi:hypothetical protein